VVPGGARCWGCCSARRPAFRRVWAGAALDRWGIGTLAGGAAVLVLCCGAVLAARSLPRTAAERGG